MTTLTQPRKTDTSTLRLSEYARKFVYPPTITRTVWPRVEAKGLTLGLGFDWWQSQAGMVCLGYDDSGRYVATVGGIGMSIPRQVGKTYFVLATLVILCILYPGLQVVWTAHHLRTSTKTFTSLRGICRRNKVAPHVRAMRSANGEQQVEFVNGSMIMFGARSQGFGRGFDEIDVEVFDEAQILDTKALEDMIAATNQARHEHGALLFFMGTPPRPTDPSEAFRQRREEAWSGTGADAIWLEISADPGSLPDDESQWPAMNPSFPLRTPWESMMRLRKNLKDDDSWNREGRGIWERTAASVVIAPEVWDQAADEKSAPVGDLVFAVDAEVDRSAASIAVAGFNAEGRVHVELADWRPDVPWAGERLVEMCARHRPKAVVVDSLGPAASLIPMLEKAHVPLLITSAEHMKRACGGFVDSVEDKSIAHTGLERKLTAAVLTGGKRPLGDAWAWKKRGSNALSPLVAVTLAHYGCQLKLRKPAGERRERRAVVL